MTTPTTLKPATFAEQTTFSVGDNPQSMSVADVNRDGNADVVTANQGDRTITVLLGDGRGNFTAQTTIKAGGYNIRGVNTADMNHDGNMDVVMLNDNNL